VPYPIALGAPLLLFVGTAFVTIGKLYRMLFGSSGRGRHAVGEPFGV
jgi:hypothetical protein